MDSAPRPPRPHGWVEACVRPDGLAGAAVQLSCGDRGAVRSSALREFAEHLAEHVLLRAPETVEDLAHQDWIGGGPSVLWALRRLSDSIGAAVAVERLVRFEVPSGWVHAWRQEEEALVLLAARSRGRGPRARVALDMLASQIHEERAWEVVVGDHGPEEVFDPLHVVDRPWRLDSTRSVQAELERQFGAPWTLEGYVAFRVQPG